LISSSHDQLADSRPLVLKLSWYDILRPSKPQLRIRGLDRSLIDLCDRPLIDPGGIVERSDQRSPLPSDPAGREDIMSDEQAGRDDVRPAEPERGPERGPEREPEREAVRPGGEDSPLPPDPARREDIIRDGGIRDDVRDDVRADVVSEAERPERRSRR